MPLPSLRSTILSLGAIVIALPSAFGAADDPFITALPGRDTQSPEGARYGATSNVAEPDGAATFQYPIEVPPGRNGMSPSLALAYSSNAPLRGGLAVGWSMSLPTIERDPESTTVRYLLTLDGKPRQLVPVPSDPGTGTRYRLEVDDGATRIARNGAAWTVHTPDGRMRSFAGTSASSDGETRWNLTSERDAHGNEIVYVWSPFSTGAGYSEYLPLRVEYTSNAAAGLVAHGRLRFNWSAFEMCPNADLPKGAQGDHHFGKKRMRGGLRLSSLETEVRDTPGGSWRLVRRTSLSYDATQLACVGERPALRYLTKIDATAWSPSGVAVSAPPARFTYGPAQRLMTQRSWSMVGPRGLGEFGLRRGPEAALMDFDGDGITDQVRVVKPPIRPENDMELGEHRCRLFYRRGFFGGGFDPDEREMPLPTAAWFHSSGNPIEGESCSLNGQYAWRQASASGPGPTCSMRDAQIAYQLIDWDHDGDLDLITGAWQMGPDMYLGGDFPTPPQEPGLFSDNQHDPNEGADDPVCNDDRVLVAGYCAEPCEVGTESDGGNDRCQSGCAMFDSCSGCSQTSCAEEPPLPELPRGCDSGPPKAEVLDPTYPDMNYVWRVYVNRRDPATGVRFFTIDDPLVRDHMPVPLPLAGGTLAALSSGPGLLPGLIDLDGDGRLDLLGMKPVSGGGHRLEVWRGLAGNQFDSVAQIWSSVIQGRNYVHEYDTNVTVNTGMRVADMNGDGLPDIVRESTVGDTGVFYNMHGSFELRDLGVSGPVEIDRLEMPSTWSLGRALDQGWRATTRQLVDIDDDGLPEIVSFTPPGAGVEGDDSNRFIRRFDGNPFIGTYGGLGAAWEPLERLVRVDAVEHQRVWWRVSDFVDVTGDGREDLVTWRRTGLAEVMTDQPGAPARLMTRIDNGRGGVTSFTYGVSTDPTMVTGAVRNDPRWLVRQIAVAAGHGQPEQRTTYRYGGPSYRGNTDERHGPGFLGYASVTAERSGQAGDASSRVVRTFRHDLDRARQTSERTELKDGTAWIPVRELSQSWQTLDLFGGTVKAILPDASVTRTFRADGSLAATRFRRELWSPRSWPYVGGAVHYENTGTEEGTGDGSVAPLRSTRRLFQVRMGQPPYAATDYRMLQTLEDQSGYVNGQPVRLARTTTSYSDATGLPVETVIETGGDPSRTVRTFSTTGLVLTTQRPNQVAAASGRVTRFTYDGHQLFVARTVNELGHTTSETRDVATGALLRSEGPNFRTVTTSPCFIGPCTATVYEPTIWTIDGFGRTLTRAVATEPASGNGYVNTVVEWTTHDDVSVPNRRITERLRDWGGTVKLRSELELDGVGRVLRSIERSGETGIADAETRYTYDAGGGLEIMQVPDPRIDVPGALVSYVWRRDGLGRVLEAGRPDGTSERAVYDGLEQRLWTQSPTDGAGAETRLVHDALGRLVQVREHDNPGVGAIAITTYEHDALDRVVRMVDADGADTRLEYDRRGQRSRISRGSRSWFYSYDADGNLIGEVSPVNGWSIPTEVLSISGYDDLGRMVSHIPARRGLSSERRQQLAADAVTYVYDAGANGVGKLTSSFHARPAPGLPHWRIDHSYGLRGELRRETRAINVDYRGTVDATQWVDRTYDATGAPLDVTWDDGTTWRRTADGRGRTREVRWLEPGVGYRALATYTRSVAGPPRVRSSVYDQRRDWTYDVLGRVTRDRVYRPSNGVTLAERDHAFDDFGRLLGVGGHIDGRLADSTYTYDRRGRVTAASVSTGYDATFKYSAGGNVMSAVVHGALDTPDRQVNYRYGAVDPHAVDRLDNVTTGAALATLTYDGAGNLTTRAVPGGTWQLTWDGDDLLREASGPTGIETYYHAGGTDRILAIQPDGSVKLWFGESETLFRNGAPVTRWHHIRGDEPVARIENRISVELQYADTLQNLALTVSSAGAVTSSFVYGPFGELVAAAGTETHRRQFNGKESDEATGLRFYGYRSCDPLLLRWISADPLYRFTPDAAGAEPQRANLYAFSSNNPLRFYDPDGRDVGCDGNVCWATGGVRYESTLTVDDALDFGLKVVTATGSIVFPLLPYTLTGLDRDEGKRLDIAVVDNFLIIPITVVDTVSDAKRVVEEYREDNDKPDYEAIPYDKQSEDLKLKAEIKARNEEILRLLSEKLDRAERTRADEQERRQEDEDRARRDER